MDGGIVVMRFRILCCVISVNVIYWWVLRSIVVGSDIFLIIPIVNVPIRGTMHRLSQQRLFSPLHFFQSAVSFSSLQAMSVQARWKPVYFWPHKFATILQRRSLPLSRDALL